MTAPQDRQNFRPSRLSVAHVPQITGGVWRVQALHVEWQTGEAGPG